MRIVGGKFRGHSLFGPQKFSTRPTSDRVRESIFNILTHGIAGFDIAGARVLDLFAGTGAMGFEALSHGAKFCQFVDDDATARGVIRRNAESLGVTGLCKVWRRDATRLGPCSPQTPFDIVFVDPPYDMNLTGPALHSVLVGGWLQKSGIVVLEEATRAVFETPSELKEIDRRHYGDTQVIFAQRSDGDIPG